MYSFSAWNWSLCQSAWKAQTTIFLFDKLNEDLNQNMYQELLVQVGPEFLCKYIKSFFYYLKR